MARCTAKITGRHKDSATASRCPVCGAGSAPRMITIPPGVASPSSAYSPDRSTPDRWSASEGRYRNGVVSYPPRTQ